MNPVIPPPTIGASKYKTIVADPPWPMPETGKRTPASQSGEYIAKGGRKVNADWWGRTTGKTVKLPYAVMELDEIRKLRPPAAPHAHLYLWTDEFMRMIERVSPGPYLELFAREYTPLFPKRTGWDVWGNEVASDIELES